MDAETPDEQTIAAQAERCRRLASMVVDDEFRHSLEELAEEYEAKLPGRKGGGFMLCDEESGVGGSAAGAR